VDTFGDDLFLKKQFTALPVRIDGQSGFGAEKIQQPVSKAEVFAEHFSLPDRARRRHRGIEAQYRVSGQIQVTRVIRVWFKSPAVSD